MNTASHSSNSDETISALIADNSARSAAPESAGATRWLALGAVVGPVLLALAWVVFGLLRPAYSPIHQLISDLGLGANALGMNAAFVLSGILLLAGVVGIVQSIREISAPARWTCAVLLALSPLGCVVVGFYSEALPTLVGHFIGAMLVFQSPVIGFLVTGLLLRRSASWRGIGRWLLLASPLTGALGFISLQAGLPGGVLSGAGLGGLAERVALVEIHAWYVALAWLALVSTRR